MIRIAKQIGVNEDTNLIVTGDILGEQASQTLDNLYSYNDLSKNIIILRPLIGCNKQDIIDYNKKIGLYEISSRTSASCQFNPQYPETHAKQIEIKNSESNLNLDDLVFKSIKNAEVLEF
jgi:thiamine biosynthesis protein ThiI